MADWLHPTHSREIIEMMRNVHSNLHGCRILLVGMAFLFIAFYFKESIKLSIT